MEDTGSQVSVLSQLVDDDKTENCPLAASGYARGDFDTQVSYLQEQINALVASNEALTNQVYYTGETGGTENGSYSNLITSSS